jgi:hypothetical protein
MCVEDLVRLYSSTYGTRTQTDQLHIAPERTRKYKESSNFRPENSTRYLDVTINNAI